LGRAVTDNDGHADYRNADGEETNAEQQGELDLSKNWEAHFED